MESFKKQVAQELEWKAISFVQSASTINIFARKEKFLPGRPESLNFNSTKQLSLFTKLIDVQSSSTTCLYPTHGRLASEH